MLLDEFVTITVYSQNVRHFVECGYEIPKRIKDYDDYDKDYDKSDGLEMSR